MVGGGGGLSRGLAIWGWNKKEVCIWEKGAGRMGNRQSMGME
jgi:hypothetical protein